MARPSEPVLSSEQRKPLGRGWIFFIAGRYVRTRRRERKNVTAFLSILGLAVGVATLITVLSIMNALQSRQIESIIAFDSYHLRIGGLTAERILEKPSTIHDLRSEVKAIHSIVPFTDIEGLARGYMNESIAIRLRAVPPEIQRLDDGLTHSLSIEGGKFDIGQTNSVVLGANLAQSLGMAPGDQINVMVLPTGDGLSEAKEVTLTISGIFSIGFNDFDSHSAFISLATAKAMVGNLNDMRIGIKLEDREADWSAAEEVSRILVDAGQASRLVLSRDLVSWRQYNAALFGALRMEKLMIMLVIGLVFIVVAVNIFHDLRRSVFEKTEDIGILRALGAPARTIQMVFMLDGCVVGFLGGLCGILLGWLLAININGLFQAAEWLANTIRDWIINLNGAGIYDGSRISLFLLDHVPSRVLPEEAIGVGAVAFLSAAVAALAASRRVSRIKPAEILRNE